VPTLEKHPDEKLDYLVDWSDELATGETIATSAWDVPAGLTGSDETNDDTSTLIFLAGGTAGTEYLVTNTITTSRGVINEHYLTIHVGVRSTYDPDTDVGKVRLLISDVDLDNGPIFTDAEIATFLILEAVSVRRAAAQALDVIASNEALVQKRIQILDLRTDGPAVARALRDHAAALRDQVDSGVESDEDGEFEIAQMVTGPFGHRQAVWNGWLRRL
jgi:hypothetical protein